MEAPVDLGQAPRAGWGIPPVRRLHVVDKPHAAIQRGSFKDKVLLGLWMCIVLVLSSLSSVTLRCAIYVAFALGVVGIILFLWFYIVTPTFLAVVRLWFSLLDWLLSSDGFAIRLMRLQVDSEEIDLEIVQPLDRDMAPQIAVDVQLEAMIEGEATEDRKRLRRQLFRRMRKETLVVKMVQHCRSKLGTSLTDRPETRMALDKVIRDFCADLCVRHCDRDNSLPLAIAMYFIPMESEIQAQAIQRGWFAWMQRIRFHGRWSFLFGFGSPAANLE